MIKLECLTDDGGTLAVDEYLTGEVVLRIVHESESQLIYVKKSELLKALGVEPPKPPFEFPTKVGSVIHYNGSSDCNEATFVLFRPNYWVSEHTQIVHLSALQNWYDDGNSWEVVE